MTRARISVVAIFLLAAICGLKVGSRAGQNFMDGEEGIDSPRLEALAKLFEPNKTTHATVEYVDMPSISKETLRDAHPEVRALSAALVTHLDDLPVWNLLLTDSMRRKFHAHGSDHGGRETPARRGRA